MVAIVGGSELGLNANSGKVLGEQGELGSAGQGRAGEGVTINAVTGNLVLQRQDEFVAGQGLDLDVLRTYNSQGLYDGDNDDQWALSYSRRITGYGYNIFVDGDWVTRANEEGVEETYIYESALDAYVYRKGDGSYDTITFGIEDEMLMTTIWTDGTTQTREIHDFASGALQKIVDTNGNELTLGWDGAAGVASVTNEKGEKTEFVYGTGAAQDNVVEVRTRAANGTLLLTRVRYGYDGSNRLTSVTVDLSPEGSSIADNNVYVTTYTYDGASKRIASIAQTDGSRLEFTYTNDRVTEMRDVRSTGNLVTTFTYGTNQTTVKDPRNSNTVFSYDTNGRVVSIQRPGTPTLLTQFAYDANGNVASVTDPSSKVTAYEYDSNGNRILERDALGNTITRIYGSRNQLLSETTYTVRDTDLGGTAALPQGAQTSYYAYDAALNLRFAMTPDGRVTEYRYAAGQRVTELTYAPGTFNLQGGTLWSQAFDAGAGGLSALPASYMSVSGDQLVVLNKSNTTPDSRGVRGVQSYLFGAAFHAEVTLDGTTSGRALIVSADNALASGGAYRRFGAYFIDGTVYALVNDISGAHLTSLGAAVPNKTYVVEVETLQSGVCTLYVYEKGTDRALGLTSTLSVPDWRTSWQSASLYIETYGGPGQAEVTSKLDNLSVYVPGAWSSTLTSAAGLGALPANMSLVAGGLQVQTQTATADTYPALYGSRTYAMGATFHAEVSIGAASASRYLVLGAAGDYRMHGIYLGGDTLYAHVIDDDPATPNNIALGTLLNNATYEIDVVTEPDGTSTLYVYEKGKGRSSGFIDRRRFNGWTSARTFIEGRVAPGLAISTVVISALSETPAYGDSLQAWAAGLPQQAVQRIDRTYDLRGQVISATTYDTLDANGIGVSDGTQTQTQYTYDTAGQLLMVTYPSQSASEAYTYDGLGRVLTARNTSGETTVYLYDDAGNKTKITLLSGNLNWMATTLQYDAGGKVLSSVRSDASSTNLNTTTYLYSKNGQLLTATDPTGQKKHYIYDLSGRLVEEIDTQNMATEYVYDASSRVIKTIRYANAIGVFFPGTATSAVRPSQLTADDRHAFNVYDTAGRLIKSIDEVGAVVDYTYDGAGQLIKSVQRATLIDPTVLSTNVRPLTQIDLSNTQQAGWVNVEDPANDRVTRRFYTADGLAAGELDGEGYLTEYRYNAAGQVVETIGYATQTNSDLWASGTLEALRADATAVANPKDRHSYRLYNARGQMTAAIDAESYLTEFRYDADGHKVAESRYAQPIGKNSVRTDLASYVYSATQTAVQLRPGTPDPEDSQIAYGYEPSGRLSFVYRYSGAYRPDVLTGASDGSSTVYLDYDGYGNPTITVAIEGSPDGFYSGNAWRAGVKHYDTQGRLIADLSPQGYDNFIAGVATEDEASTRYVYDAAGRLIRRIEPLDANGQTAKTLYFYDTLGRLAYVVNAAGEVTKTTYNSFGDATSTTRFAKRLDATTLLSLASATSGLASSTVANPINALANAALDAQEVFIYNARGEVVSHTNALNVNDYTVVVNAFGEKKTFTVKADAHHGDRIENFTYDRRGLTKTDAVTGFAGQGFAYDAFGRLTQVTDGNLGAWTTTYDRLGREVTTTAPGGTTLRTTVYDAFDRIVKQFDALGNPTTYTHDSATRSVSIQTPENITTTLTKNAFGETVFVRDGNGNTTTYEYDLGGRLRGVSRPVGTGTDHADTTTRYDGAGHAIETTDANGVKTAYTYDAVGRVLKRVVDPSTTNPAYTGLNLTTYTLYDGLGEAIWARDASGVWTQTQYDAKGQVTAIVVDPTVQPVLGAGGAFTPDTGNSERLALRTEYTYDNRGNTLTVTEGAGSSNPKVTKYDYDIKGRRIAEHVDPGAGRLDLTTRYSYDGNDNVVARVDANTKITRYVYDARNQLIYSVDAVGAVTKFDYDAEGRVIQTTVYADRIALDTLNLVIDTAALLSTNPQSPGRLVLANGSYATNSSNQITRSIYDKDGRLRFIVDGGKYATEQRYDKSGNVITITRYAKAMTTLPNPLNASSMGFAIQVQGLLSDTNNRTTRTVYDKGNRATFTIDADNFVTQYLYDNAGQVTKRIRYTKEMTGTFTDNVPPQILGTASGTAAQVVEAPDTDRTTRTYYDAAGRLRYSVDAEGYLTRYGYNERGDQTSLVVFGVNHGANSARPITDSDTLATLDALTATLVAADVQHVSDYDRVGRLRTETVQTTAGAFDATRYAYDALGRLVDTTHHWNMTAWSVTHRDYDAAGRLTDVYEAYGWPAQTHVHYELDKMGNRLKIVDTRGTELAERDNVAWAQNTRVALGYPALVADLSGWQKDQLKALYTTTQEFDAVGQLIQSTDALGGVTKTAYDVFGNAVKITDPNGSVGYFYFDAENRLQLSVDPEGYATRQEYNAFDQVTKQTRYGQKVNAGYSETMSLATMLATSGTVYLNPLTAKDVVTRTEYDKRGNAKAIYDSLNVAETYTYDAFGDKRTFTDRRGSTYEYAYDHRGLLASEKSPAVYVTVVDANGVPSTSQAPVNIINKYSYDARGNLVQLREAADTAQERVTTTTYDALNRAVHTDLPAVVLFDPIAKTNSAQAVPRNIRATYDTGGNKVEAWDERSQRSLYYYDRLNRLVAQLDVDGTLHEYEYDSAGNRVHERAYGQPLAMASQTWWTRPVPAANSGYREMFYVYDANNMRIGSRTQTETLFNPDLMLQGGAGYYTSAVNTFAYYDANGNLVRSVDGRGYVTLYFYNKLGQQTLVIDPLGYGVQREYDAVGHLIRESKYEKKLSAATLATLSENSNQQTLVNELKALVNGQPNQDRVIEYDYNLRGQKTAERLLSVRYTVVDAATGLPAAVEGALTTSYGHDENGNVIWVKKPDNLQTDFEYDKLNRLIRQGAPQVALYAGSGNALNLTQPYSAQTRWSYDALGRVTREIRQGVSSQDDQVKLTRYDAAGNALMEWDALGNRTDYDVDAKGNVLRQTRSARDVDNVLHTYKTYFAYDAKSRETSRCIIADENTGIQVIGDNTTTAYNAYGDVTARGINGYAQHEYRYDKLGRLFWTNADTGTPRIYVYDANGNAVLEIWQAAGTDLNALQSPTQINALQDVAPQSVQMKFSLYDARNQATDVFQAPMDFTDLTGGLSVEQQQQLASHTTILPGTAMHQTGGSDPGSQSSTNVTKAYLGAWTYLFAPPPTAATTVTYINPTQVNQATQGQNPVSLAPSDNTVTTIGDPVTQTKGNTTTVTQITTKVRTQRTAAMNGLTVEETITVTTTKETNVTITVTTRAPDVVDYVTGTVVAGQLSSVTTSDQNTTQTVKVSNNKYQSFQSANVVNQQLGGQVTTNTNLLFIPAKTSGKLTNTQQQLADGDRWTQTIKIPVIDGYGTGAARVRVVFQNNDNDHIKIIDNLNHTTEANYSFSKQLQWFGSSPSSANLATRVLVQIWKDGELLVDQTVSVGYSFTLPSVISVRGVDSSIKSIAITGGSGATGYAGWMTRLSSGGEFNIRPGQVLGAWPTGGVNYIYRLFNVATPTNWQADNDQLIGAISGTWLGAPEWRVDYFRTRTDISYSRTEIKDDATSNWQQSSSVQALEQSNYLKQLVYTLVSGESKSNQIRRRQAYNAFGEIVQEIDGRGNVTKLTYNELGQVIRKQDPTVAYTNEHGVVDANYTPITNYYVDAMGQTVGQQDANGFKTTQVYVNGRLAAQFNPDGYAEYYAYDEFGNMRAFTPNTNGLTTRHQYDKKNRMVRTDFAGGNHDIYEYDAFDQMIGHTNGLDNRETYVYDGEGRITRHRSFANRTTNYTYQFVSTIGERGGYRKRTQDANGTWQTDDIDVFGKLRSHIDLGGRVYTYVYNSAGWLTSQNSLLGPTQLQNITYSFYNNGYLKTVNDIGINSFAQFQYDLDGNRIMESYSQEPLTLNEQGVGINPYQVAKTTYDGLNRITSVEDAGKFHLDYEYDKVGNRRRVVSTYYDLLGGKPPLVQDFYYKYDAMNRFTTTMGMLDGSGNIVRGTGYDITYNGIGQRMTQTTTAGSGSIVERYDYDNNGFLTNVWINNGAQPRSTRINNAGGEVTDYLERNAAGQITSNHHYIYDADHIQTRDTDMINGKGIQYTLEADGRIAVMTTFNPVGSTDPTVVNTFIYEKWDTYQQKTNTVQGMTTQELAYAWKNGTSRLDYDVNGHVRRMYDNYENRTIDYVNNQNGQTLKRLEYDGDLQQVQNQTPLVIRQFYYFDGRPVGDQGFGEDAPASRVDYAQTLRESELEGPGNKTYIKQQRLEAMPAEIRNMQGRQGQLAREQYIAAAGRVDKNQHRDIGERVIPVSSADFDQNFLPINRDYPAHAPGVYVVKANDTLQDIAAALWGDASLWYLIADANSYTGNEQPVENTRLTIPNVVTNIHNNASTFRPFEPGLTLGNIQPTLPPMPPPPKKDGCGGLGTIIVAIIAIVVVAIVAPVLLEPLIGALGSEMAGTVAAYALAGAAGSLASQGAAIAMGMQRGISWNQVATAAIGSGVTAGLGTTGWFPDSTLGAIGQAAASSVITQGISVATGLQKKFSWTQVAAAAAGAGMGNAAGRGLYNAGLDGKGMAAIVRGTVAGIVNGGTQSLILGERPNWGMIAAQSFGQSAGQELADRMPKGNGSAATARENSSAETASESDSRSTQSAGNQMARTASGAAASTGTASSTGAASRGATAAPGAATAAGTASAPSGSYENPTVLRTTNVTARAYNRDEWIFYDYLIGKGYSDAQARHRIDSDIRIGYRSMFKRDLSDLAMFTPVGMVRAGWSLGVKTVRGTTSLIGLAASGGDVNTAVGMGQWVEDKFGWQSDSGLERAIGKSVKPVVDKVRNFSEQHLGDGITTVLGAGLEVVLDAASVLPVARAAGAVDRLTVRSGSSTLERGAFAEKMAENDGLHVIEAASGGVANKPGLKSEKYVPVVASDGRRVYKNLTDFDSGAPVSVDKSVNRSIRQRVENGWTNLDLMREGYAPIGYDGKQVNLHHVLGKEAGPMAELTATTHQKFSSQLHGLIESGRSFRNDPVLNKQYNDFRREWWKDRAADFE